MSDDAQAEMSAYIAELASRDAPPYEPKAGDRSMLAGIMSGSYVDTRDTRLAKSLRRAALDWLVRAVAFGCNATLADARTALLVGIPDQHEHVLDGGCEFIFVVDQAAMMLGADPDVVRLRPRRLHS